MLTSRASRTACLAVLAALAAAASTAPAASAATQRYASPTGSGSACTAASPCSLINAIAGASSGAEVIVAPGDYPVADYSGFHVNNITVHGVVGQPRPRLLIGAGSTPRVVVNGSTLRYLEIDQAPAAAGDTLKAADASLDQVIVKGSAQTNWTTVWADNTVVRNSVIVAPGSNATAIGTEANGAFTGATLRNVTAIATEPGGVAIRAEASGAGYASVLARNVIARGGGGSGGVGLWATTDHINTGATAKITIDHSNWLDKWTWGDASVAEGPGNQTSAPVFVSAAGGDYHQAPGSPTIGAGLPEFLDGDFDIDGDARQIGKIDIGADEFVVAPAAITGVTSAVTAHSATLAGTVNPNGAATSSHFEYGPTTAYGSNTPAGNAGSGGTVTAASTLGGLSPSTTYHYRLVAVNSGGTTKGADRTFTTTSATPPTTTPPTHPAEPFAGVELVSNRLTYTRRSITVTLRCPAGTVGRCSGRAKLTARNRHAGTRRVTLGRARFSIAPGSRARVKVRVTRAVRRLLHTTTRVHGRAVNAAHDGAGHYKTTVGSVTIQRRHR